MNKTLIYKIVIISLLIALSLTLILFTVDFDTSQSGVVIDNDGNELSRDEVNDMPTGFKFAPVANSFSETTIRVTASVKPDDATNKNLIFSILWVNAGSQWATGKKVSDYLTVSSSSNVATITCKKPFGERAKLVAVSQANENIKAECTIDFQPVIESFSLEIYAITDSLTTKLGVVTSHDVEHGTAHIDNKVLVPDIVKYETNYKFVPKFIFGLGTIESPNVTSDGAYLNLSNSFINEYNRLGGNASNIVASRSIEGSVSNGYITRDKATLALILIDHGIASDVSFIPFKQVVSLGNCVFEFYLTGVEIGGVPLDTYVPFCFGVSKNFDYVNVNGIEFDKGNISF